MALAVEAKIRALAAPVQPSEAVLQRVLADWARYFEALAIPVEEQLEDFDATMRARVQAGVISILPDRLRSYSESESIGT